MFLLHGLLILFWMLVVPFLVGTLIINQVLKENTTNFLLALVCGIICMMSFFYILVMPMLFLRLPLHVLVLSLGIILLILSVLSLYLNRNKWKSIIKYNLQQLKALPWYAVLVIFLIVGQAFILAAYQHDDADDAFFVGTSNTDVTTDTISQYDPYTGLAYNPNPGLSLTSFPIRYVLSPFPSFIALLSKLVMVHPAIVSHTVIPALFIPLSYAVLAVLGKRLFPENSAAVTLFILFLCAINIFGFVSVYTNSTFLLFRIWQGKAVLANIVLPATLYFSVRAMSGESRLGEWTMLFACALTACLASSMGIVLVPVMTACLGLAFAIRNRTFRTLKNAIICCTPCIACGIVNIVIQYLLK